jgi:hypothetical protein
VLLVAKPVDPTTVEQLMQTRLVFKTKPGGQVQVEVVQTQFPRVVFQTHPVLQPHAVRFSFTPVLLVTFLQAMQIDLLAEATEEASHTQVLFLTSQTIPGRQKQENGLALVPLE